MTLEPTAAELLRTFFNDAVEFSTSAPDFITKRCQGIAAHLACVLLPEFLTSGGVDGVLRKMLDMDEATRDLFASPETFAQPRLWPAYSVPADVANWLYALIAVAETLPLCITLADMTAAGSPLVYINAFFTQTTGYERQEALGRNCRFLQGPGTQLRALRRIGDKLRRGVDCLVELTNYHKSGDAFRNLLCLRPVHDSNQVYRFCIGVQLPIDDRIFMQDHLKLTERLLGALPTTLDVGSATPAGPPHTVEDAEPGEVASLRELLRKPMQMLSTVAVAEEEDGKVSCDPIVGRAQSVKSLTKLQAATMSPEDFAMLLENAEVQKFFVMYVHSRSEEAEEEVRSFFADDRPEEYEEEAVAMERSLLGRLHADYFVPLLETKLFGEVVEALQQEEHLRFDEDATWVEMLAQATRGLSFALCLADMQAPGARLVCVNPAFTELTGY